MADARGASYQNALLDITDDWPPQGFIHTKGCADVDASAVLVALIIYARRRLVPVWAGLQVHTR